MKAKKLSALLVCLLSAFVLFSLSASAEGECAHKFEWKKINQTCTSDGYYKYECTECGYVDESQTEIIPAHNYTSIYIIKYATCNEKGLEAVYCDWCKTMDNREIPMNGSNHAYGEWNVTPATCNEEGKQIKYCTRSGCKAYIEETLPVDITKHVAAGEWQLSREATCYIEGLELNTCAVCGEEMRRYIPVHNDCATDESGKYLVTEHREATCWQYETTAYFCYSCGQSFTVTGTELAEHDFSDESLWFYDYGANCKKGKVLKCCKNDRAHTVTEDANLHIFEGAEVIVKEPSCSKDENGETVFTPGEKKVYCVYCTESETVGIPAGEHSFGKYYDITGICSTGGTATRTCTCGEKTETVTYEKGTHLNYTYRPQDILLPRCLYEGYIYAKCDLCSEWIYVHTPGLASKGEHTEGEWVVTKEATCYESGEKELHCAVCDAVMKKEVIAQRPHSYIHAEKGIDATCTEDGITPYLYCTYCAKTVSQEVIAAFGHNFVEQNTPEEGAVKICDVCYQYEIIGDDGASVTCKCLCHNSNGLAKTLWKFVTFFCKLFGFNQECKCGIAHY